MTAPRCRRYHPVWLTHAQMDLLESLCDERRLDGSCFGNREQYTNRLEAATFAIVCSNCNCVDEMERPKFLPVDAHRRRT